ncbi:nicotinate (nicotinamide) nucleotide adenylyltransferase [Candidatus Gottesmanbacteria bacterium]|nr:nicotinate (nicotinamide) nucleotide adenylyltransferase [Candidatus Gottesmanbacteria bacterium]
MDKTRSKKTIAIFGGSFDPPHLGHVSLIKKILKAGLVDEIWLVPNFSHKWKKIIASPNNRFKMCQLLIKNKTKVCDIEIKREGKSYAIDTIRELKREYPGYQFYWLAGKDLLRELPKWKDPEALKKEIEFIAFPKTNVSSSKIRERIKKGLSITGLVPKKVEEYIRKHKLYV